MTDHLSRNPIDRCGACYPALIAAFLVLTAFPLYASTLDDYGNLYYLATRGDDLSVQGIVLLAGFLGVLGGSVFLPRNRVLPIVSAVLAAILILMVAVVGPAAYSTPPPITGTGGMAVFLGVVTIALNVVHVVLLVAANRSAAEIPGAEGQR